MKVRIGPIVKQIVLHELSILFCNFRNAPAYHLGRYKPSSAFTKELHGKSQCYITVAQFVQQSPPAKETHSLNPVIRNFFEATSYCKFNHYDRYEEKRNLKSVLSNFYYKIWVIINFDFHEHYVTVRLSLTYFYYTFRTNQFKNT